MQKQVQKSHPPQPTSEFEQPILCDGCDRMIEEEQYVEHWEKCIQEKRNKLRKERERKKKEEQEKRRMEEEEKMIQEKKQRQREEQERKQKQQKVRTLLKTTCQKCGQEIPPQLGSVQNHKFVCIQRQEPCQFCNDNFPNYLMQDHHQACEMRSAILQSRGQSGMSREVSNQRRENVPRNNRRAQQPNQFAQMPGQILGQVPPNWNMLGFTRLHSQSPQIRSLFPPEQIQQLQQIQQVGFQLFQDPNGQLVINPPQGQLPGQLPGQPPFQPQPQGQNQGNPDLDLLQDFYQSLKPKQKFSQSQIKALKKSKFQSGNSDEFCTLCRQDFNKGDETFVTQCQHTFHYQCIPNWLKNAVTCPNCKSNLKQNK